jgi:hypothetical protein
MVGSSKDCRAVTPVTGRLQYSQFAHSPERDTLAFITITKITVAIDVVFFEI